MRDDAMIHSIPFNGCTVTYWGPGHVACDFREATFAVVEVPDGQGWKAEMCFTLPGERERLNACTRMLALAHRQGDMSARAEIRRCLGITS